MEEAYALSVDGGGNVYVAGYTSSFGAGNSDAFLLKYSGAGDLLWQKTWGGTDFEQAYALSVDGSGYVYLGGFAPDINGSWAEASGSTFEPGGNDGNPSGADDFASGTENSPSGTEGAPDGVQDIGGGGSDALVMKFDPSLW